MHQQSALRGTGSLPLDATEALPGSEAKIQVMIERAERREQLFHPQDGLRIKAPILPKPAPAAPWQPPLPTWLQKPYGSLEIGESDYDTDPFEAVEEETCIVLS